MNPRNWKLRWATAASLLALSASALLPMSAVAGPVAIKVDVTMGDRCINGTSPAGTSTRLIWKNAALNNKKDVTFTPPDSNWEVCASTASHKVIETGDQISVEVGPVTHLLTVPELTLRQNRVNDVYRGRGPAGDYVRLICGLSNGFEPCVQSWKLKVNSAGNWGYNPGWNVTGGDFMSVNWTSPAGDKVRRHNYAPYMVVTIERATVSGSVGSDSDAIVMLKNATTLGIRGLAEVSGSPLDGEFASRFTKEEGELVRAKVGNIVVSDIAADAEWTLQNIQASPNVGTQRVNGHCPTPTGLFVRAWIFRGGAEVSGDHEWPEEDGSFRLNSLEFESGDKLLVSCDLPTGDRIQKFFAIP